VTLRWGIVGTGTISQQMAGDLSMVRDAEVAAVSSRDAESADAFANQFGIPNRYSALADLLASDIDVVYIGTPHVTHFAIAAEAIAAGKHVLCEKPMGLNAAEVRELGALASKAGVFLMEAMWMKFNPLYVRLTQLVAAGELGEIHSVTANFGIPFPKDDSSRWKPGGSTLLDQGIYPVTLAHLFLGAPDEVVAKGVLREDGVDLSEYFTLSYDDGRYMQGGSSMVDWLDLEASVCGSKAWVTIDAGFWGASKLTVHRPSGFTEDREVIDVGREGNGYVPMLRAVAEAIEQGLLEHPLHTTAAAAEVFDTLDEIRRRL